MDFHTPASTWLPLPPQQPAVTLTSELQNLTRSLCELLVIQCKFHWNCSSGIWNIV